MFRNRAFSLLELLMVIAIIVVLLSLMLPAFLRSHEVTRSTSCRSAMRETGTLITIFANENDDRLPGSTPYVDDEGESSESLRTAGSTHGDLLIDTDHQTEWHIELATYSQMYDSFYGWGTDVFACTSDEAITDMAFAVDGVGRATSYGMNYYTSGELEGFEKYSSLEHIRRPSKTIFLGEMTNEGEYGDADHFHPEQWFDDPDGGFRKMIAADRHLKTPNWLYLDGHAAGRKRADMYDRDQVTDRFIRNQLDPSLAF